MSWERFWRGVDTTLDGIIFAWDMLMMYVAALYLIPMCVIGSLKLAGIATLWTVIAGKGLENAWLRLVLLGAPVWLVLTLYARFSSTPWAVAFHHRVEQWKWAVIWATCAGLAIFAGLAVLRGR